MTSAGNWARVNDLFHRALEVPAEERPAFLASACGDDVALRNDVASLLAAHDQAAGFIERPAADPMLFDLAMKSTPPLVGRVLGHYRVDDVLGEGGMGVVYLAEDTRLGRPVALKALPARYTQDATSRDRLRREARAAAALAHPGIATVYALEQFDDDLFIAFEFVPGETLRTELRRGPLAVPAVVDTALGIARALAAAHDRGIIHRDLKPENVIRTPSRDVKILDFGLARFREPFSPTVTLSAAGAVMGTPAYMSPEQIRAEAIDARSDLFSLGVVLYELASGTNPFLGADHAATIANVLELQPPRLITGPATRPDQLLLVALDEIIFVLLRKTPGARFQSAHELIRALEPLRDGSARAVPGSGRVPTPVFRSGELQQSHALWWWKFHQAATSVTYLALLAPLWIVHNPGRVGLLWFLSGLVAALVASLLRLHLWFTVRSYPEEWATQRQSTGRWITIADIVFAAVLLLAAAIAPDERAWAAVLFVSSAVAVVLSFSVIEPATTRAAFGRDREKSFAMKE